MLDIEIINDLKKICNFTYKIQNEKCTYLSFFDNDYVFSGLIRHSKEKSKILKLISKLENIKYLNLNKCKISNIELSGNQLEYLNLGSCNLRYMPKSILNHKNIKELNLGANLLKKIDLHNLNKLEIVKLHKNKLYELPSLPVTIKNLNLYLNNFEVIPDFKELSNLEVFSFGCTNIKSFEILCKFKCLKYICLVANNILNIEEEIFENKNLLGLLLAKNSIKNIPNNIGNSSLKELTLFNNKINQIPKSLFKLKLNKFNISQNNIDEKTKQKIIKKYKNINLLIV